MNHFSKKEITGLLILFVLISFSTYFSRTARLYHEELLKTEESFEILLYERMNTEQLAGKLDSLEIDFDKQEFIWAANTLGWRNYHVGRYLLSGEDTYASFLSKLGRGIQDPGNVTILPGTDRDRLSKRLAAQLKADSVSFRKFFEDSSTVARELGLTGEQLFARMWPETYQMYWTSSPEAVIKRLHSEFESAVVNQHRNQIEEHPLDLNEIITLASIVEWEARLNEEKPIISGLYLNRLERNMLLQADPTVIYALGERRRLLYQDYELNHPYNTYRVQGLPPGPITNPDLNSIKAVLNPEKHDYLYMVATPEGGHRFSETYSEHQEASAEWRKWIREQYRIRQEKEREQQSTSSNP